MSRHWTQEQDQRIIDTYESGIQKGDGKLGRLAKELGIPRVSQNKRARVLGLTPLRDRKVWTEEELCRIKEFYASGLSVGDGKLEALAKDLGVHKTNLCRKAKALGCVMWNVEYTQGYKERISTRIKEWYEVNEHPKGFLGGKHTPEARVKMGAASIAYMTNETLVQQKARIDKAHATRLANGNWFNQVSGEKMYSNAKAGRRKDLGNLYYRSRTESNYARYLKHTGVAFEYEKTTLWFDGVTKGPRGYVPDFYLPGKGVFHEFKGWFDSKSQLKMRLLKEHHPEIFDKLIMVMEIPTVKVYTALEDIGFREDQIIDFRPIDKLYKNIIEHWELPNG